MQKKSRLLQWIDWIYETVKLSFLFWKEAFFHGGVFGFMEALAFTTEEASLLLGDEDTEEKKHEVPFGKVFSFAFSTLLFLSFITQAHLAENLGSTLGLFLVTIAATAWTLLTIYLISLILESRENDCSNKNLLMAETLLSMFKKPLRTLYAGSLLFSGFLMALISPILLFALVPGAFVLLVLKGDESLKRKYIPNRIKQVK